jgi:hypothetical protein
MARPSNNKTLGLLAIRQLTRTMEVIVKHMGLYEPGAEMDPLKMKQSRTQKLSATMKWMNRCFLILPCVLHSKTQRSWRKTHKTGCYCSYANRRSLSTAVPKTDATLYKVHVTNWS